MEAVPVRNRCLGVTDEPFSIFARPKPSVHTISPSIPTAIESPARLFSEMLVRTIWQACSAAPAHFAGGGDSITDGIFWESRRNFVAVTLMYTNSPGIPTASSPTPKRISETYVGVRLFDIFPRAYPLLVLRRLRHLVDRQSISRSLCGV